MDPIPDRDTLGPILQLGFQRLESGGDREFLDLCVRRGLIRAEDVSEILDARQAAEQSLCRHLALSQLLRQHGWLSADQVAWVENEIRRRVMLCPACLTRINVFRLKPGQRFSCTQCESRLRVPADLGAEVLEKPTEEEGPATSKCLTAEQLRLFNDHRPLMARHGFTLLEMVSQGGMGVVYKAIQNPIQRTVAIKVLLAELSRDPDVVRRFCREARALGRVAHPNVASIHHAAISGDQYFLVLQWIEGADLGTVVSRGGPIALARALPLFMDVARALAAVHAAGYVHRDVKPANIILRPDGSACVVDLGLVHPFLPSTLQLTRPNDVMGTAQYISPEQFMDARSVTPRSDVYSLGATLYHVLGGRVPFPDLASWIDLGRRFAERAIPRLDGQAPRLGLEVVDLVARMMAHDPEDRPAGMEVVHAELGRLLRGGRGMAGDRGIRDTDVLPRTEG